MRIRSTAGCAPSWSIVCRCPTTPPSGRRAPLDAIAAPAAYAGRRCPTFYIGAHAVTEDLTLITRDVARYRTYFPSVKLVAPDGRT